MVVIVVVVNTLCFFQNKNLVSFPFMNNFDSSFKKISLHPIIKGYHNLDEVGLRGEYPWVDKRHDSQAGQQPVCLSINVCDCDPLTFYYNAIDEGDT